MSKNACSFNEPDVLAACEGSAMDCMKAWQQRGNAATCVRCRDCGADDGECLMRCSTDEHADAPLKRMDCAEGCDKGTCKDTLECGDHEDIFMDTYDAAAVTRQGEARVREAKIMLCKGKTTKESCKAPCSWDDIAKKCSFNEAESLARVGLNAADCTDPVVAVSDPMCQM